jgi:hypothetical protein
MLRSVLLRSVTRCTACQYYSRTFMKKALLLLSATVTFIVTSCYYHKEDLLYGSSCDTTNVTYANTITGLLNNYGCLGCHVGSNPSGGINLETYNSLKTVVDNGRFFGAITHASGFKPMPDGAAKMNPCDINKVKAWIAAGTP